MLRDAPRERILGAAEVVVEEAMLMVTQGVYLPNIYMQEALTLTDLTQQKLRCCLSLSGTLMVQFVFQYIPTSYLPFRV